MLLPPQRIAPAVSRISLLVSTALLTVPAFAQDEVPQPVEAAPETPANAPPPRSDDIVVTAERGPGSVITDVQPDEVLDEAAIASFGASNLTDLLAQLAVRTRGSRGRGDGGQPVVLLSGRRISGFGEIRNLPPEAIQRVEIFPEEVALEYGYAADQRVINFILRTNFSALFGEVEGGGATAGGYWTYELEASLLQLTGRSRLNITVNYEANSPLTEVERGIISDRAVPLSLSGAVTATTGSEIDPALSALAGRVVTLTGVPTGGGTLAQFAALGDRIDTLTDTSRTLISGQGAWSIDGTFARPLGQQSGFSVNARYVSTDIETVLGLSPVGLIVPVGVAGSPFTRPVRLTRVLDGNPLLGTLDSSVFSAGASVDGRLSDWRWSLTGSYDRGRSTDITDLGIDQNALQAIVAAGANPFADSLVAQSRLRAPARAFTATGTANTELVLSGTLFELPAGRMRSTLQGGWRHINLFSRSERSGLVTTADLGRTALSTSANVDVPIASRDSDVLAFVGDLSVNAQLRLRDVSDFALLTSWTVGLDWSPIERISLLATWVGEANAPSVSQLGAVTLVTPLRVLYDFTRGETVLATVTSGGNPALLAEERRDFRAQANWQPIADVELNLSAAYARTRSTNTTAAFPLLTGEIEAAFPGRVARDTDGRIVSVDQRPVNFAATRGRQLRTGISFSRSFGQAQRGATPPVGGGMFGGPGGGGGPGGAGPAGARPPGAPPVTPGTATPAPAFPPAVPAIPRPPGGPFPGAGRPGGGPGGGGRGPGGGGGFGGMFGGGMGGRWDVQLFHTVRFEDEILIRPGVPVLDLLNGSATGESGGSPRHEVELSGGRFFRGIGFRVNGTWRAPTTVSGAALPGGGTSSDLRFGDQFLVNARMFVDLGQQAGLTRAVPFLRGARIRLAIDNIFNDIRNVRDENGLVPLRYQPGYVDPQGRTFELSFRKQF